MASAYFNMRLRPLKQTTSLDRRTLTAAERSQRWRDNLKISADKYKEFKAMDSARKRISRKIPQTEEQKERIRKANRERQRKFRERRKTLGQENLNLCKPPKKVVTRKGQKKQREYWRRKQRESREKRSSQKIRRKREKDRKYISQKRKSAVDKEISRKTLTENDLSTSSSLRKAVQRAKLPKNPEKFATTMKYILKGSPNKRQALEENGLLASNDDRCNRKIVEIVKEKLKNGKMKKSLLPAMKVMKKYKMLKTTSLNLGVNLSSLSRINDGIRKSRLNMTTERDVQNFFQNISTPIPDRKSVKRKEPEERKILDRPLKSVYTDYTEGGGTLGFSTFAKKVPSNIQTSNKQRWYSCLCEYCTNVDLKLKALNDFANRVNLQESKLTDRYHAVNITLCDKGGSPFHKKECVERKCKHCNKDQLLLHLAPLLSTHGNEAMQYTVWEKQNAGLNKNGKKTVRVLMVKKRESLNAMVIRLADHLDMLANHLFVAKWQQKQFTQLISNIPPNWVVLNLDFAENYACISQMEIQTAHWGHNQATIHPIVSYYNCNKVGCQLPGHVQEALIFVSNDLKHDCHAVNCFIRKTNDHLRNTRSLNIVHEVQMCDGCAGQYKACIPFCDISYSSHDFGFITERNFYGSRHGKGPSDGAGAVVKSAARRAVNSQTEVINNAKDLAEFAERKLAMDDLDQVGHTHKKRTIFYVDTTEINRNREERGSKTVSGTRALHSVRSKENPRQLLVRHLSCFCTHCVLGQGQCDNKKFVEEFREIEILRSDDGGSGTGGARGGRGMRTRGGRGVRGGRGAEGGRRVRARGGVRGGREAEGARRGRGVRTRGGRGVRGKREAEGARGVRTRGRRGLRTSGGRGVRGMSVGSGSSSEDNSSDEQSLGYTSSEEQSLHYTSSEEQSLGDLDSSSLNTYSIGDSLMNNNGSGDRCQVNVENENQNMDGYMSNSNSDEDLMEISGLTEIIESLEEHDRLSPIWDFVMPSQEPALELAQPSQEPTPELAQPAQEPAIRLAQPPQEPALELAQPFQEPAPELAQPSQKPALELAQPAQEPSPELAQPAQEPAIRLAQPPQEPALELAQPFQEPAPELAQPSQKPALELAQPAQEPSPELAQPAQEPAPELAHPAQEPALELAQPAQEPALELAQPAQEPAPELAHPAQEPALELAQPAQEPAPELAQHSEEPAPELAQPSEEPAPELAQPSQEPALELTQPSQEPAPELRQPAQEPAPELAQPSQEPAPELAQPAQEPAPQPPAQEPKDSGSPRYSYPDGTYIQMQLGSELYPAVVHQWPWISFFVRGRKGWHLQETRHTAVCQDVVAVIPAPDLEMYGRRYVYVFKDL